ncbi:MAG: carboxypeptidase regulatory-like domain-containing protein [Anaerolineae bacterium]|nr:carboxypeptidase regulatory-like domain-containing protein [Anaerolineae bacterium]
MREGLLFEVKNTNPNETGIFQIEATVNPDSDADDFPLDNRTCNSECHFPTDFKLPAGHFILELVATDPDGHQASIQRNIAIDLSGYASVPVQVIIENDTGWALANIPIQASTRLYLWRTRYTNSITNMSGYANVRVETLALAPTRYIFCVEPTIVDGVLYESIAPIEVIFPPGAKSVLPITLKVHARNGRVTGRFLSLEDMPPTPPEIWIIHLPDGAARKVSSTKQGSFYIDNLPLSQYLFTADPESLISQGYVTRSKTVDLTTSLDKTILLSLSSLSGQTWRGGVKEKDGKALPFAWLSLEKTGMSIRVQPDGTFTFFDLAPRTDAVVVNAPGYYSQVHRVDFADDPDALTFELIRRPDTVTLPWGNGEVVIPPETVGDIDGDDIMLERGWIWGHSQISRPLIIWVKDVMISPGSGRFALEHDPLSGQTWLYVFEGEVVVHQLGHGKTVKIQDGQMVVIIKDELPVPALLNPVVFSALHENEAIPVSPTWESTLKAQLRDRVALIGIGTAQVVTFILYGLILVSIVAFPLVGVYLKLKRRCKINNEENYEREPKER